MSSGRIWAMVARDLKMGPRSPVFLWCVLMPLLITFLLQVVLLALFDPVPRVGIVDFGASRITGAVRNMEDMELTLAHSVADLRNLVEKDDVDAGLVLPAGFDGAVRSGKRPPLVFYVSGESPLSTRLALALIALDLVRKVENRGAPVEVVVHTLGSGPTLVLSHLLVLFVVLFAIFVCGIFVPAFMLVEERENGTLTALLATPATMREILLSKALLGFAVTLPMALLTLALNGTLGARPGALVPTLAVGVCLCVEIGMIYATLSKDAKTLYTLSKSLNILIMGPAVFYVFPQWPQWIAKIFPSYWFIDPLYRVAIKGASLGQVWLHLAVALGIGIVLLASLVFLVRRMEANLATQ